MKIYNINRERLEELGKTKTYREIADMFDCSHHTVYKHFKKQGIPKKNLRMVKKPPREELEKHGKTKTFLEIADIYDCSRYTVRQWFRDMKIPKTDMRTGEEFVL